MSLIDHDTSRRGLLKCMAWAGTGLLWGVGGGLPRAAGLGSAQAATLGAPLTFLQISDTHIGFNKAANPDVLATLRQSIALVRALPAPPAFVLHTGDVSHLSKPEEFDIAQQVLGEMGLPIFHVPGEHDVVDEGQGKAFFERFGKGTNGGGWYSFDAGGVHFVALVNVTDFKPGGLAKLGAEQIEWLENDLAGLASSTPVVVFAHIPLWTVAADWGWGTEDAPQALSYLRRFGSVTVLNGHIHQVLQKVEGRVAFHTARSTAYPQPAPGTAPSPGPLTVPAGELGRYLGVATLDLQPGGGPLAIVERPLLG